MFCACDSAADDATRNVSGENEQSAFEELHFAKIVASAHLNGFKITRVEWELFGFANRIRPHKRGVHQEIVFLAEISYRRNQFQGFCCFLL